MKKLFVLLAVFMLMGCAFSTEQKVMPFLILETQKRPENFPGWTDLYMQKCSPDFPLKDAKLICTVRVNGKEVCSDTLMIGTPFTTFWDYSVWEQNIAFGLADKDAKSALIKRVIPWMTERKPMIRQQSRVILQPNKKVTFAILQWKKKNLKFALYSAGTYPLPDGTRDAEMELELRIPEDVMQKYTDSVTREELLARAFLKTIDADHTWKITPSLMPLAANWDDQQYFFNSGKINLKAVLRSEVQLIREVLKEKDLPQKIRTKLQQTGVQRLEKIASLTQTAFDAGITKKRNLDRAKADLEDFKKENGIRQE